LRVIAVIRGYVHSADRPLSAQFVVAALRRRSVHLRDARGGTIIHWRPTGCQNGSLTSCAKLRRRGSFSTSSPGRGFARRQHASGRAHQIVVELIDQCSALHQAIWFPVRGIYCVGRD
jgi:hypothetical protein